MTITNLLDYKKKKQEEKEDNLNNRIISDINHILLVLEKTQQALSFFKKYKPIQEIISIIETNKTLFTLSKKKHAKNTEFDKDKK
jgi:hypothetical protein